MVVHLNKCCVYTHSVGKSVIYVGSGSPHRAFSMRGRQRGTTWLNATKHCKRLSVIIVRWFSERRAAFEFEKKLILRLKPIGNILYSPRFAVVAKIPHKTFVKIKKLTRKNNLTVSQILRRAIREYLNKGETK